MGKRMLLLIVAGLCVCAMVYIILPKTLMTRSVFKAYKAMDDRKSQLPMLQNATHQYIPVHAMDAELVGAFRNTPTNHTEINPREAEKLSKLRQEMLCRLKKKVPFSTITRKQAAKDKNNGVLPEESLEKLVHFNSCAVVSSSHALRLHTYGREIDSHDAVLRFNCAPTHTFEQFVGKRTDIRLINTLIPHRKCGDEFWSENSTIFTHGSLVIRNMDGINLEPRGVDAKKDPHHAFDNLIKYRKTFPNRSLPFIQRPRFGQDIKTEMARFCASTGMCEKTKMSPSTGLFGVVMMMHLCDWVHVYEFVPSNRDNTTLIYYFAETAVRSPHDLHSYNQERTYVKTLSLTPYEVINDTGVVLIQGLSQTRCG
ncbi:beta-galactoside alpha-2,6-sialyltransferase 2-like [Branchiostoma lanceolatum]|uniref:beta-galactoside alpha-2,6-sialyltransferase 2-like n=1 Tax=Branchiostoma lanceolatum TaxID=7740 RepID=UPI00345413DE